MIMSRKFSYDNSQSSKNEYNEVQVVVITYNQVKYIRQAMDSFLNQRTNFRYSIFVGDDCSTDGTAEIVEEYAKKYPKKVFKIAREHNYGAAKNLLDLCSRCTAKYLAFCEGDDYWTDPNKLQLQFDYMEEHINYRMCFTKTIIDYPENWSNASWYKKFDNGEIISPDSIPKYIYKDSYTLCSYIDEYLRNGGWVARTSSFFFRWNYEFVFPDWMYEGQMSDAPILCMQLLDDGIAGFIPTVTSCWRRSEVGITMDSDIKSYFIKDRREGIYKYNKLLNYFRGNSNLYPRFKKICDKQLREYFRSCQEINDLDSALNMLSYCPEATWDYIKLCQTADKDRAKLASCLGVATYVKTIQNINSLKIIKPILEKSIMNPNLTLDELITLHQKKYLSSSTKSINHKRNFSLKSCVNLIKKFMSNQVWDRLVFDEAYYLNTYRDVDNAHEIPQRHYFKFGIQEGRRCHSSTVNIKNLWKYWIGALYIKSKNKWAFSAFYDKSYLDNTKYLFEFILKYHPEIDARWLTTNNSIYEILKAKGYPVLIASSKEGRNFMRHCAIAVTDHFRVTDYNCRNGFNARTKVVNLWHGIGLKAMTINSSYRISNTTAEGARLSDDIIINSNDSFLTRIRKKILYFFRAPFRELYENYFFFLTPGDVIKKCNAKVWKIPESATFDAGYPRNSKLYDDHNDSIAKKIIYAPTYRWNSNDEVRLIDNFIATLPSLNSWLQKNNCEFYLRLHPHTWRNYAQKLNKSISCYNLIKIDNEKDVYTELSTYSIMISDYSSIAWDFLLMDKPVIFFMFDKDSFVKSDTDFWYPIDEYSPGLKAFNWMDVINCLTKYLDNPKLDEDYRHNIVPKLWNLSVNNKNDSERIVNEIKKRLKFKS